MNDAVRAAARCLCAGIGLWALAASAAAQCPPEPNLQNFTGTTSVACPCFIAGEEAGVVLDAPASHYPIEILKIEITWGSQFGGAPQSLEQAIHIYPNGLPNPGTPQFSLPGPVLTDGFVNQFDIEPIPGNKTIDSGPFLVSLEFFNSNAGMIFAPSVVHDGNGCQPGKNAVFAIPGGWSDACTLGVSGDWRIAVQYRRAADVDTRNGGTNPLVYTGNPMRIGTTWTGQVDVGAAGQTSSLLFGFDSPTSVTLASGQTLLALDTGPGELLTGAGLSPSSSAGGIDGYTLPIPPSPGLCSLELFTQAVVFGNPPFALTNAQDYRIGQ